MTETTTASSPIPHLELRPHAPGTKVLNSAPMPRPPGTVCTQIISGHPQTTAPFAGSTALFLSINFPK